MPLTIDRQTLCKYDVQGPRYTSYPTAPEWSENVRAATYQDKLKTFGQSNKTLSLYLHIPFCQKLCYFCACHTLIRKQEDKYGDEYLRYMFREIELVSSFIGSRKDVRQFHWGGGTPTYLSTEQIERLFLKVEKYFKIDRDGEVAIEIDPRTIDLPKLKKLKELGFNRISFGIQDFDPKVQEAVNRIQPYEMVVTVNNWCRQLKFPSVNFDLIYGLPFQTLQSFSDTVKKAIHLRPDRIALYNFAYLPWLKKHQAKFTLESIPANEQKVDIFIHARDAFIANGYQAIAMDHFALENDELARSFANGKLYRNFMGYTVKPADEYIGLGSSAISFLEHTYTQDHKILSEYYAALENGQLPIERGMVLSEDDRIRQWVITALMCQFEADKNIFQKVFRKDFDEYFQYEQEHIHNCVEDGLLTVNGEVLHVTELGRIFIRNICMGFDWYLRQKNAHRRFSRTI